jgi:hypothetical protein
MPSNDLEITMDSVAPQRSTELVQCTESQDNLGVSDDALAAVGLLKVQAFVRSEAASANSTRLKRARKKAADAGRAQVNVVAPVAAHAIIKEMAREMQGGMSARGSLERLLSAEVRGTDPGAVVKIMPAQAAARLENLSARLRRLTGWRRWLAKMIGLL